VAGVFEDARHDAVGKFESAAAGGTVDDRLCARADRFEERAQFGAERFFGRGGNFLESDFRLRVICCRASCGSGFRGACIYADAKNVLAGEIERDVFVLLEEAHLADAFGGDAAGGEIRDGAGFKFDAGVGDVHFVADDGNAHGFEINNRRVDEREQDVEVMDHYVVDDVNIQAARRKNAEAVDFEKHRTRDDFSNGDDGWIEAFDVTDLENASASFCGGDERVGFIERCGDGLFDEHVNPGREDARADTRVFGSRDSEAHGVNAIGRKCVEVAKNACAEFRGNFLCAIGIGIDDADELGAFDFAPDANMVASEIADADDSYADGFLVQDFLFASRTGDAAATAFAGANA